GAGGPGAEGIVPSHARTAPGKPQASAGGTPVGAPARPHRLAVAAARRGLEGLDPNAIPGNLPIADVWARMAAATSLTVEALARELARILPVREADLAEA